MVDELDEIPERYKERQINFMFTHLGGTAVRSPSVPLLKLATDVKQCVRVM